MRENSAAARGASASAGRCGQAVKALHIDLRHLKLSDDLAARCKRAASLGFTHLCAGPLFQFLQGGDPLLAADHRRSVDGSGLGETPGAVVTALREACDRHSLKLVVDLVLDRVAVDSASMHRLEGAYRRSPEVNPLDPRLSRSDVAAATLHAGGEAGAAKWWAPLVADLAAAGAQGFRLIGLPGVPRGGMRTLLDAILDAAPDAAIWPWTPGLDWSRHEELREARLAAVFGSTCWWDGKAAWYVEEHEALRRLAPVLGVAAAPYADRPPAPARLHRDLMLAAATAHGLMVSDLALEAHGVDVFRHANGQADALARQGIGGELRGLSPPGGAVAALLRVDAADARAAHRGVVIAVNADGTASHALPVDLDALPPAAGGAFGATDSCRREDLKPGEVRLVAVSARPPAGLGKRSAGQMDRRIAKTAATQSPVAIEGVRPFVSGGTFAVKHVVGRTLTIEADIFADGHDVLAAEIVWLSSEDDEKRSVPLVPIGNDRWRATVTPGRIGRHYFGIEAWRDEYATLCHALEIKHRAGIDVAIELIEAAAFLEALPVDPSTATLVQAVRDAPVDAAVRHLTAEATRAQVASLAARHLPAHVGPIAVDVERPQAEFAAWYELFPRSLSGDASRHGTFDDVIAALPRVRAMGFDVLYFPPIHPIGRANRKGPNNSLTAGPGDPGSPYAIGAEEGGHDAIHPALGTPEDFRRLVRAAHDNGLEIALDFAIQCSLDHPWLREHPGWFKRRPDGSIKYAENPPKKYEDIVNVDFHADDAVPDLWLALRDVVLHWAEEGVGIFRVDNPHTKPLTFWHWMIGDIRARHPDVIFLSEAFTRPKMMYRLAKVGFSQSYTYFTWRNTKREIVDYLRELTTTDIVDYFRPHFFVNTPDINPLFLQSSGRPGFLIRACLAATLSGLWGIYSGFELCEAAALPGREEYLDSEKYELRPRDFAVPGNIVAEITLLNRLRRAYPALQSHRDVTFYNAFNDRVVVYGKRQGGGRDLILVAVSLDPHAPQQAAFEIPLWEWGLPDDGALAVEDLVRGGGMVWHGKLQSLRLDPAVLPFAIWRLAPQEAS